jgi:hypothetical protein
MAFPHMGPGPSFQHTQVRVLAGVHPVGFDIDSTASQPFQEEQFDMFDWYPKFQSCVRYFLDHAQYSLPVQAVAAFVNIQLPYQQASHPVLSSKPTGPPSPAAGPSSPSGPKLPPGAPAQPTFATITPYIRRLVATGFDYPAVLHGFFGDDWAAGIGPMHETERRNYLFAAKSDNWLKVKANYDMAEGQAVPYLRPLQNVSEKEIQSAEQSWSDWLAMQDWMLGPRAPPEVRGRRAPIKSEQD